MLFTVRNIRAWRRTARTGALDLLLGSRHPDKKSSWGGTVVSFELHAFWTSAPDGASCSGRFTPHRNVGSFYPSGASNPIPRSSAQLLHYMRRPDATTAWAGLKKVMWGSGVRWGGGLGCPNSLRPRNSEDLPKLCQTHPDLWKLLKIAEFRTPTPVDFRKKGSKILKLFRFAIVLR